MSVARGLNRDKFIWVGRFSRSENFACEREELVIYVFINFSQCKALTNRGCVTELNLHAL